MPPLRRSLLAVAMAVALTALAAPAALHAGEPADAQPKRDSAAPKAKTPRAPAVGPTAIDPMNVLRERLAAKLGAAKAEGQGELRVSTLAEGESRPVPEARKPSARPADRPAREWSYDGDTGPQSWGRLKPEFAKCASGTRQSPIDIRDGIRVDLDPVQFDYRPSSFRVLDNGHTVQVNVAAGNSIEVMGRRFDLVQFHFHRPAEERIEGRQYEMVAHLVHKDDAGRLAVVAVLLERGAAHPLVQAVWNNLPLERGDEVPARALLDPRQLLPEDARYFIYMGSLTTPPCTEGVLWMVMQQPLTVSSQQIDIFARLYPMNARPIQQASGRLIKQSN